jgi:hypothetical protein
MSLHASRRLTLRSFSLHVRSCHLLDHDEYLCLLSFSRQLVLSPTRSPNDRQESSLALSMRLAEVVRPVS